MIDFRQLRGLMSHSFDTDNLVSVTDPLTKTTTAENIPCHFVITSTDNPGYTAGAAQKPAPVTVYGEIYTSETPIIRESNVVVIEKKDTAGNVIATYEGKAAMPAYRAGRVVTAVEITSIASNEEPAPPAGFNIKVPDGAGGYLISKDRYAVEEKKIESDEGGYSRVLVLTDPRFEVSGNAVYIDDSELGGRVKLFPYAYTGTIQFSDGVTTYKATTRQAPVTTGDRPYILIS